MLNRFSHGSTCLFYKSMSVCLQNNFLSDTSNVLDFTCQQIDLFCTVLNEIWHSIHEQFQVCITDSISNITQEAATSMHWPSPPADCQDGSEAHQHCWKSLVERPPPLSPSRCVSQYRTLTAPPLRQYHMIQPSAELVGRRISQVCS